MITALEVLRNDNVPPFILENDTLPPHICEKMILCPLISLIVKSILRIKTFLEVTSCHF